MILKGLEREGRGKGRGWGGTWQYLSRSEYLRHKRHACHGYTLAFILLRAVLDCAPKLNIQLHYQMRARVCGGGGGGYIRTAQKLLPCVRRTASSLVTETSCCGSVTHMVGHAVGRGCSANLRQHDTILVGVSACERIVPAGRRGG